MENTTEGTDPAELYRRGCELVNGDDRYVHEETPEEYHRRHMRNAANAQALFVGALAGASLAGVGDSLGVDYPDVERRWFQTLNLPEGSDR